MHVTGVARYERSAREETDVRNVRRTMLFVYMATGNERPTKSIQTMCSKFNAEPDKIPES